MAYIEIYEAAKFGNLDLVQALHKQNSSDQFIIQMAIIGAVENRNSEIAQWALENGACLIFAIKHLPNAQSIISHDYSKRLSMLNGPGEVTKGTFKKS